jgi:hypothetical protein
MALMMAALSDNLMAGHWEPLKELQKVDLRVSVLGVRWAVMWDTYLD